LKDGFWISRNLNIIMVCPFSHLENISTNFFQNSNSSNEIGTVEFVEERRLRIWTLDGGSRRMKSVGFRLLDLDI
jgi:hypothetical protein